MIVEGLASLFMSSLEELGFSLEKQNRSGDRIVLHIYMEEKNNKPQIFRLKDGFRRRH